MSKEPQRVTAPSLEAGVETRPVEMAEGTRTAAEAAAAIGCALDQIAKSIVFHGSRSDEVVLFLTAGGGRVDPRKALGPRLGGPRPSRLTRATLPEQGARTGPAFRQSAAVSPLRPHRPGAHVVRPAADGVRRSLACGGHAAPTSFAIAPVVLHRVTGAQLSDFTT